MPEDDDALGEFDEDEFVEEPDEFAEEPDPELVKLWQQSERAALAAWPELDEPDGPASERSADPGETIRNDAPRTGRNEPCPCGSGKKFKKCCGTRAR